MFSGIITHLGQVQELTFSRIKISSELFNDSFDVGESIAVNGICLTIIAIENQVATFDISEETFKTTKLALNSITNLERSLRYGDLVGGHLISGHVDGIAEVKEIKIDGEFWEISYKIPVEFEKFVARKGSIALDGISLTVARIDGGDFMVSVVPHTLEKSNLSTIKVGDKVNFEVDMFARYISRSLEVEFLPKR